MYKPRTEKNVSVHATHFVIIGSLTISGLLTALLLIYDIFVEKSLSIQTGVMFAIVVYSLAAKALLHKKRLRTAQWMMVFLYEAIAFGALLVRGLNAPIGILTMCFVVILPGILMGARYILPVGVITGALLIIAQLMHDTGLLLPTQLAHWANIAYLDLLMYLAVLTAFGTAAWLSRSQLEQSLKCTRAAESELRHQKEALRLELKRESARLRQAQLNQIQQLHKFALIGQSTAATLHDLSNQLSIINLDIYDLKQQHSTSKAVSHAEAGIDYINKTVQLARQQLNSYDHRRSFNVVTTVKQLAKDMKHKFDYYGIELTVHQQPSDSRHYRIKGDPLALMQVISILLNNAFDACKTLPSAKVEIVISIHKNNFVISVIDDGPGVTTVARSTLFKPQSSTKPSGLGIGLYIAYHLTKTQFHGKIQLKESEVGAHFKVTLPSATRRPMKSKTSSPPLLSDSPRTQQPTLRISPPPRVQLKVAER